MEHVYPKPTTQAMMIRLIQDYYDCPVFYLPWTREALTVHLHAPLDYAQLEEAENAEGIEKQERDRQERQDGDRRDKLGLLAAEATLDFDMGTDLVRPDVFTKQMYMRTFIRYELEADKASAAAIQRRVRLGTMAEDPLARSKSRSGPLYIPSGLALEGGSDSFSQPTHVVQSPCSYVSTRGKSLTCPLRGM